MASLKSEAMLVRIHSPIIVRAVAEANTIIHFLVHIDDRSIYVTFYSVYYYIILNLFLIYLSYLFSFSYFVGFGSKYGEVSWDR